MTKRNRLEFTVVTIIIGFMIAIQFQSINEPKIRDTRDVWELRADLLKEQKLQANLIKEARNLDQKLASYETEKKQSKEQVLRQTLHELKKEAGLTAIKGPGVIVKIEPLEEELIRQEVDSEISPELLKRLLNELNMYGALHVSINGQRMIHTTVIRDINGITKMDGFSLTQFPIEIKVIAEDANKLRDRLKASQIIEDFFIENLKVHVSVVSQEITLEPYGSVIRIKHLEPIDGENGGDL